VEPKKPAVAKATVKVQNLTHEQEYQDLELSSMRRTIAKRLTASKVCRFQRIKAQF
jgi:pyruvate/2-oxoglutarate dehydrogenase complex dihydrolipoamide acyltransferase (E2) component